VVSPLDRLLVELAGAPALPGAACKGMAPLYERTVDERRVDGRPTKTELENARSEALGLCNACPALDRCRAWLDSQRVTRRPRGVVAGQVITSSGLPSKDQGDGRTLHRARS
jgi:hypothetical protein